MATRKMASARKSKAVTLILNSFPDGMIGINMS